MEIRVEGGGTELARFERALRKGPPSARVQELRREVPDTDALPARFEIVH